MLWLLISALVFLALTHVGALLFGYRKGYWRGVNEKAELPPLTEDEKRHGYFEAVYKEGPEDKDFYARPSDRSDFNN